MKLVRLCLAAEQGDIVLAKRQIDRSQGIEGSQLPRISLDQTDMGHGFGNPLRCVLSLVTLALFHRLFPWEGWNWQSPCRLILIVLIPAYVLASSIPRVRSRYVMAPELVCAVGGLALAVGAVAGTPFALPGSWGRVALFVHPVQTPP